MHSLDSGLLPDPSPFHLTLLDATSRVPYTLPWYRVPVEKRETSTVSLPLEDAVPVDPAETPVLDPILSPSPHTCPDALHLKFRVENCTSSSTLKPVVGAVVLRNEKSGHFTLLSLVGVECPSPHDCSHFLPFVLSVSLESRQ